MSTGREHLLEERRRLAAEVARLDGRLGRDERDSAGELAAVDQHPADLGTELYERERDLGRREDLQRRLDEIDRLLAGEPPTPPAVPPSDPDDDRTPLDEPEEPPVDLGALDVGLRRRPPAAPPGEIYREGQTLPDVGEDAPGDEAIEGEYRPD